MGKSTEGTLCARFEGLCEELLRVGPVWSATGATISAPAKSSNPGAPSAPNPPPASLSSSGASSSSSSASSSSRPKQGMAAVFQEISSKPFIAGLRKVTDDMKAKNRKDGAGFVSSGEKEARKSAASAAKVGPPKLEVIEVAKWTGQNGMLLLLLRLLIVTVLRCHVRVRLLPFP